MNSSDFTWIACYFLPSTIQQITVYSKTLAEDGDALDALVIVGEATFPGCYIRVEPVGGFEMWDEKGPDQKILCVPRERPPQWNWVQRLDDVPHHLLKEITHFSKFTRIWKKKETKVGGIGWERKRP